MNTLLKNENYFDSAFCPIDLPNLGNPNSIFQMVYNSDFNFVRGLLPTVNKDFAYIAENGAYWDHDRVLFYSQAQFAHQTTGKFYTHKGIENKLSLNSKHCHLNRDVTINCISLQEDNVPFKSIAISHYDGGISPAKENLLLLGITLEELQLLKNAAIGTLSEKHHQYPFLEEIALPTIEYRKFQVKVQGLDENGESMIVAPQGDVFVTTRDGLCFTSPAFTEYETVNRGIIIVIDPGHGAKGKRVNKDGKVETMKWMDGGAIKKKDPNGKPYGDNVEYKESKIALDISEKIKNHIISLIPNATVYLTREGEVDLLVNKIANEDNVLAFRWKYAIEKKADMLVSIHCNSPSPENPNDTTAKGFAICYHEDTAANKKLAEAIIAVVDTDAGGTMSIRNIAHYQKTLGALRGFINKENILSKEAILIEVGFISNAEDVLKMTKKADSIAKEIATGIKNYINAKN